MPVTSELRATFLAASRCPIDTPYVTYLSVKQGRNRVSFAQSFKHLLRRLGMDDQIRPHDLRRTLAVHVLEATGDVREVQAVLGHKRLTTTMHYLDHDLTPVRASVLEKAKLLALGNITEAKQ